MMAMSKFLTLALVGNLAQSACREIETSGELPDLPQASAFESSSLLQLHPPLLSGAIDWNLNLELFKNEEVLQKASLAAQVGVDDLKEATEIVVNIEQGQVRVVATHEDGETAKRLAESLANSFLEARKQLEVELAEASLRELDRELEQQEGEVASRRAQLDDILREHGIPHINSSDGIPESDLMTYEKAKKALEEDPVEDGVLYRKDE